MSQGQLVVICFLQTQLQRKCDEARPGQSRLLLDIIILIILGLTTRQKLKEAPQRPAIALLIVLNSSGVAGCLRVTPIAHH